MTNGGRRVRGGENPHRCRGGALPSAEEFLRQEVVSSPLAGPVGALDGDGYRALGSDLAQDLLPCADDDGIAFPMQTWLVTAAAKASGSSPNALAGPALAGPGQSTVLSYRPCR